MIVDKNIQNVQVGQVVEYEYRLISDILSTMGDKTVFFKDNSGIIQGSISVDSRGLLIQLPDGMGGLMPAIGFSSLINDTSPFLPHSYSGYYLEIASTFFKAVINNEQLLTLTQTGLILAVDSLHFSNIGNVLIDADMSLGKSLNITDSSTNLSKVSIGQSSIDIHAQQLLNVGNVVTFGNTMGIQVQADMSTGQNIDIIDNSTSNAMLSIGQSGINVNNLNLINVGDALTDTDALNRQTGDLRYQPYIPNVVLSANALEFTNTVDVGVVSNMSAGKVLEFNDSSTTNTIMSIGQTGLNLNSLLITNLADALNDTDALNRQTADARYEPLASGATLSKNGIDFTNDAEIVIQGDMSSAKPITFTDSSSSMPKLSIQQSDINVHSLPITNVADPTNDTDALNRQTGDLRYHPYISNITLNRNELIFTNDTQVDIQTDMSGSKPLSFVDSSTSLPKMSINQGTVDFHSLNLTNVGNPSSATDALNRQTGDIRYQSIINDVIITRNELQFINTTNVLLETDMTAGKTLEIVDSTTALPKLSIGQTSIDAHSLKITALGDATSATDGLNRQTGDARYKQVGSAETFIANAANKSRIDCIGDNQIDIKVNNNTIGKFFQPTGQATTPLGILSTDKLQMISNLGSFSLSSGATQGAQPAVNTTGLYMTTTNDNTKNQIAQIQLIQGQNLALATGHINLGLGMQKFSSLSNTNEGAQESLLLSGGTPETDPTIRLFSTAFAATLPTNLPLQVTSKAGYSATTAITEANQFASKAYVDASAGGSSKAYLVAYQQTSIFSGFAANDHIQYNRNRGSSGITLDTTSAYTVALNVPSVGRFTVATTGLYQIVLGIGMLQGSSVQFGIRVQNADNGNGFETAAHYYDNQPSTFGGFVTSPGIETLVAGVRYQIIVYSSTGMGALYAFDNQFQGCTLSINQL